jgi:hypothetical protein
MQTEMHTRAVARGAQGDHTQVEMASRPVVNLDVRAQTTQLRVGVAMVLVALCGAVAMRHFGAAGAVRLTLAPVLLVGSYGIAAGIAGTCGLTALLGKRLTDGGAEPVADRCERKALRWRGLFIIAVSVVVSVGTALLFTVAR